MPVATLITFLNNSHVHSNHHCGNESMKWNIGNRGRKYIDVLVPKPYYNIETFQHIDKQDILQITLPG